MPLYEYQCSKCGKIFEKIQKFSDPPLELHEDCGGKVVRLMSAPAFHLKGTGWYVTDYAKSGGKTESSGDAKSSESKAIDSKSDAKSETKTETKADAKSEAKAETKTESKPVTTSKND